MVKLAQLLTTPMQAYKAVKITKVSGYVDTAIPKKCGTCHYISHDRKQCDNKVVNRDPEVPDGPNGLKTICADNGCCNEWEPR